MFYIVLGGMAFIIIVLLLLISKFQPYSEFMNDFKEGSFKKLITILSTAMVLALSYGIYYEVTNQPPFLDVQLGGQQYTIFGDIGDMGYYTSNLIYQGKETELHIVSWEEEDLNGAEIIVQYPSGKEEIWTADLTSLASASISGLRDRYGIKDIYRAARYAFKEKGIVELSMMDGKKEIEELKIKVR
ncbi:hypothetical protein [Jeotgalibacillus terrae]|uniref:DUF4956 domain-containing protein n=1 Tax=Jeotgalibacillus terrae TaxID=587735 RepID=A0ABW5ZJ79_9BACL|nr:hypothetical protein [Jeotgalibacillus terrae]MBM7578748.1 hypothetical protein [Jeotgalibacillus terrae]